MNEFEAHYNLVLTCGPVLTLMQFIAKEKFLVICFFQYSEFKYEPFFLFICFLLKDNCFTEFCCFLSNLYMNQPQVYIYPLPFEPPSHLPPHFTPQIYIEPLSEFPDPQSKFSVAIYFTYGNVSFHVTLCIHLTLSSPLPMSISLFSLSVSSLLPCK